MGDGIEIGTLTVGQHYIDLRLVGWQDASGERVQKFDFGCAFGGYFDHEGRYMGALDADGIEPVFEYDVESQPNRY